MTSRARPPGSGRTPGAQKPPAARTSPPPTRTAPAARKAPARKTTPAERKPAPVARKVAPAAKKPAPSSRKTAPGAVPRQQRTTRQPVHPSRQVPRQPGARQPGAGQPATRQPATRQPATRQPATRQPGTRQPAQRQSGLRQPGIPRTAAAPRRRAPISQRRIRQHPPRPREPFFRVARAGNPDRRLRLALVMAMVVLIIFGGRLVQLQGLNASAVAATALASRTTDRPLPAHRGDILDTTGATLATTVERRNITVDQRLIPEYRKDDLSAGNDVGIPAAATRLAPLVGLSVAAVTKQLTGSHAFAYLVKDVEPDVWRTVARLDIPGVLSEQASRRNYPGDSVAANVVGYLNAAGVPQGGIEKADNSLLKGIDGKLSYERGAGGQQIATGLSSETEPVAGHDVQLTINADLQWKTQAALAAKVKETGAESGQAVVMDPRTGDVLALVSVPTVNPNDVRNQADVDNSQDRAVTYGFEPGSTSKVITAAAALQEGLVTPATQLTVDGTINRGGKIFHDSHAHGPEKLTFAGVLAQSSNVGTIKIGERLPPATMYSYLRKFGLGAPTGVGLSEYAGILAPVSQWSNSQRYTVLFGQGVSVTALQSASVFATIANNGVRVTPRIVKAVSGAGGELDPTPPSSGTRVISDETARVLRTMLERVVSDDGTAVEASVPGYRVAGKTGTAQFYEPTCSCYRGYTASFVGMAPADSPRLVVAVYLQKPVRSYFGGSSAAPVFQQVMTYALAHLQIEPTGTTSPKVPLTWK